MGVLYRGYACIETSLFFLNNFIAFLISLECLIGLVGCNKRIESTVIFLFFFQPSSSSCKIASDTLLDDLLKLFGLKYSI